MRAGWHGAECKAAMLCKGSKSPFAGAALSRDDRIRLGLLRSQGGGEADRSGAPSRPDTHFFVNQVIQFLNGCAAFLG